MMATGDRQRWARLRATVVWLVGDALRVERGRILLTLAANLAGILGTAAGMGLLLRYLRWVEHPKAEPFRYLRLTLFEVPTSTNLLIVAVAFVVLGLGSAGLIFLADLTINRVARNYQSSLIGDMLRAYAHPRLGEAIASFEQRFGELPSPIDLVLAGSRFSAFSLRSIIQLFLPGMTLLIAVIALIALDPLTTLLLSTLSVVYLVPLYRINRSAATHQRNFRRSIRVVPRSVKSAVSSVLGTSGPSRDRCREAATGILDGDDFQEMQDARFGRILSTRRVVLLNSAFLVVVVAVVLLLFSRHDSISWPHVLGYLAAIQFMWVSVRQSTASLNRLSQFMGEVERVETLLQATLPSTTIADSASPALGRITLADGGGPEPRQLVPTELGAGAVVLVITSRVVDRFCLEQVRTELARASGDPDWCSAAVLHDDPTIPPSLTLRQVVMGDVVDGNDRIAEASRMLESAGAGSGLAEFLDRPLEQGTSFQSRRDRYLLGAAYLLVTPPPVALLNGRPLLAASSAGQSALMARLQRSITLIAMTESDLVDLDGPCREAITHVALLLERRVLSGDLAWFLSQRSQLEPLLAKERTRHGTQAGDSAADDSDELADLE